MALIRLESLKEETIYLETQTINSIINCGGRDGIGAFIFFEDESRIEVKETYGEIVKRIEEGQLK
jgi:hypothetical protein